MSTVHLAEILNDLGTTSVRGLFKYTGSPEPSVFKQAQMASINHFYQKNGGFRGPFGFPLEKVHFAGQSAEQSFAGGTLRFQHHGGPQGHSGPQGDEMAAVQVRYVGFHCFEESKKDGLTTDDEPYFIIGVAGANGSRTMKFGPYENVDSGESRFEAVDVVSSMDGITPPIVLGVFAVEHDHGTPEEAEAKVRDVMDKIVSTFGQAAGLFSGVTSDDDTHVLPEWAQNILTEGIVGLFGLGDDPVGQFPLVLFDNKADLKNWTSPPVGPVKHGGNEYNVIIPIDGGSEGKYELFFLVKLWTIERTLES